MRITVYFFTVYWQILLRNVSGKGHREKTHFVFSNSVLKTVSHAINDVMWKNMVQFNRPQMTM